MSDVTQSLVFTNLTNFFMMASSKKHTSYPNLEASFYPYHYRVQPRTSNLDSRWINSLLTHNYWSSSMKEYPS